VSAADGTPPLQGAATTTPEPRTTTAEVPRTAEESPPAALFDLGRLRIEADTAPVARKLLLTVPVRKPGRQEFIRVHADKAWSLTTATLTTADDRTTYLVDPDLRSALANEIAPTMLVGAVTRQGVFFLWPLKLPSSDGRTLAWHTSALEAAELAKTSWVKVVANMSLGAYEVHAAQGQLGEPTWPDVGFAEIIGIAFKDAYLRDADHPVLRRLRGEL
jgi:hypothetical protein